MSKNELDEMQVQKRNKIGNQSFMLLFYLLMIDIMLYGFGIKWLEYPTNVFLIMMACMTYYLVRLIWNNAYVGPNVVEKTHGKKVVLFVAIVAFISAIIAFILQRNFVKVQPSTGNDNGALILLVFSIVSLAIALIVSILAKKQNNYIEK